MLAIESRGFDEDRNPPITADEIYESATSASNLRHTAESRSATDILRDAAMSPSRVGMALIRLHSEWTSAAKPRRLDKRAIDAITERIRVQDGRDRATADRNGEHYVNPGPAGIRAHAEADRWYVSELRMLAQGLKSRPMVWEQLRQWVALWRIDPQAVAGALLHWLDPTCPLCQGHGFRKAPDAPSLGAKRCHKCHGTGERDRPHDSTKVLNYIDDCVQKARTSLRNRLQSTR